jgi:hypothetical protein
MNALAVEAATELSWEPAAGGRRTRAGLGACPHEHFPYDAFRG